MRPSVGILLTGRARVQIHVLILDHGIGRSKEPIERRAASKLDPTHPVRLGSSRPLVAGLLHRLGDVGRLVAARRSPVHARTQTPTSSRLRTDGPGRGVPGRRGGRSSSAARARCGGTPRADAAFGDFDRTPNRAGSHQAVEFRVHFPRFRGSSRREPHGDHLPSPPRRPVPAPPGARRLPRRDVLSWAELGGSGTTRTEPRRVRCRPRDRAA